MARWSKDELKRVAAAAGLHIASLRVEGVRYRAPTWIWSVVVDGDLYVRAYNGDASRWYQAALRHKKGRITATGSTKPVTFEPAAAALSERIDEAYRTKYDGSPYVAPITGPRARAATLRVLPPEPDQILSLEPVRRPT